MSLPAASDSLHSAIGDALVRAGAITEGQLTRALRVQSMLEDPRQLVEVLVELGYGERAALNGAIADQGGSLRLGDRTLQEGDTLTLDGHEGAIYLGAAHTEVETPTELLHRLARLR